MGLSIFIVLAFGQWGLRGMIDYRAVPGVFHAHGAAMLAWLSLLVAQSLLAGSGRIAVHRTLGLASLVLVPAIIAIASLTFFAAVQAGIVPPFFSIPYFMALTHVGVLVFAALVGIALLRRGEAHWHKRLMLGSTIILLEPALGRLLPMPFIVPFHEWTVMLLQLAVVGLVMRHDRRELGAVHPATTTVFVAVALDHVLVEVLAITPWWIALTAQVTGA